MACWERLPKAAKFPSFGLEVLAHHVLMGVVSSCGAVASALRADYKCSMITYSHVKMKMKEDHSITESE